MPALRHQPGRGNIGHERAYDLVTRTRNKTSTGLTLGFIGSGEVSAESVDALLSDYIDSEGDGEARFIIPATADLFHKGIQTVVAFAEENDLPVEILTNDSTKGKKFEAVKKQAKKETRAADPVAALIKELAKGNGQARLIALWDDEDEAMETAVEKADDASIPALDLTTGLDEIELTDDEEDDDKSPADDEEEDDDKSLADDDEEDGDAEDDEDTIDVGEADFKTLKAFAEKHGIEVAPRSKIQTYRREVTKWLESREEAPAAPEAADDEEDDVTLPEVSTSRETLTEAFSGGPSETAIHAQIRAGSVGVAVQIEVDWNEMDEDSIASLLDFIKQARS